MTIMAFQADMMFPPSEDKEAKPQRGKQVAQLGSSLLRPYDQTLGPKGRNSGTERAARPGRGEDHAWQPPSQLLQDPCASSLFLLGQARGP